MVVVDVVIVVVVAMILGGLKIARWTVGQHGAVGDSAMDTRKAKTSDDHNRCSGALI